MHLSAREILPFHTQKYNIKMEYSWFKKSWYKCSCYVLPVQTDKFWSALRSCRRYHLGAHVLDWPNPIRREEGSVASSNFIAWKPYFLPLTFLDWSHSCDFSMSPGGNLCHAWLFSSWLLSSRHLYLSLRCLLKHSGRW